MLQKTYIALIPRGKASYTDELKDCLKQFSTLPDPSAPSIRNIVRQAVFLDHKNNEPLGNTIKRLNDIMEDFYGENHPPTSFICQAPAKDRHLCMEIVLIPASNQKINVSYKKLAGIRYSILKSIDGKEIYASGIAAARNSDETGTQSAGAFGLMEQILNHESMTFAHVVRQWNYIENITKISSSKEGDFQNYQVFNDIRSSFYQKNNFVNGYPAATGIGVSSGGVQIEFHAIRGSDNLHIIPLRNPNQIDAHQYSQKVLIGTGKLKPTRKTSPKFERGKLIYGPSGGMIYISGTAAIEKEDTVALTNAGKQCQTTLKNIHLLISPENLRVHGLPLTFTPQAPSYLRTYIKRRADMKAVKKICDQYYPEVPNLFLIADVCRDRLLVEIEGVVHLPPI